MLLLVGPVLAYIGFGSIWLWERGWLLIAAILWILAGTVFSILAARWTGNVHPIMPPLDWDSPGTFSPRDRAAWKIVMEESEAGDELAMEALIGPDLYIDTGRRLIRRLAAFYHPDTTHPLDKVPLIELLTAVELASEDLAHLSRQVPGGDLITLSHWRRAVQVAGYISKANDLYAMVSPIINPLSGLVRLGTRELLVKPAWRDMQQNVLRWFYQAFVNRLGVHLIELMSGRLAIGAEQYRRLTRRSLPRTAERDLETEVLAAAVAGAQGAGKSRLIDALNTAMKGDPNLIRARLEGRGLDPLLADRLTRVRWIEVAGYPPATDKESRKSRSLRQAAVAAAIEVDLVVLVIDGRKGLQPGDVSFAQEWDRFFIAHPEREVPPSLVVVTGVDQPDFGAVWTPPYDWSMGKGVREEAVRALFESLRATLPPTFNTYTAAGLPTETPFGVVEHVIPALAAQLHRAERSALIRQLQSISGRSKIGRVMTQIGQQGRQVWTHLKARRKTAGRKC
ncbi:MAG: GTPase [Isosphaeraceae bacterium]